jgi:hypothetical protein
MPRLTFANVMSSIAVFIALGAGAYAAALPKKSVGTKQLKNNAVKAGKLADGAVGTPKLSDGAVDAGKLADGAVGTGKLANGAVGTGQIANGAVSSGQLANGAVGSGQLANGAVGSGKLANGAVGSAKLANGSVGASKLAPGAVSPKCPQGMTLFNQTVCVDAVARGTASWFNAMAACSNLGYRLPTEGEWQIARSLVENSSAWTEVGYREGTATVGPDVAIAIEHQSGSHFMRVHAVGAVILYHCATVPTSR